MLPDAFFLVLPGSAAYCLRKISTIISYNKVLDLAVMSRVMAIEIEYKTQDRVRDPSNNAFNGITVLVGVWE